ncbi:MAG: hypothetical protein O7D94_10320 [Planctomycetota bacterium]|nr:hypothetical protein [Planctomycetota bacterium]
MTRWLLASGAAVLACCAGNCLFELPGTLPPPNLLDGTFALTPIEQGPNVRIRIDNNAIVAFIENGVDKQLTVGGSIQQLPGRINHLTLSGFMTPFPGRPQEQWTVSFSGNEGNAGIYNGTLVFRLTTRTDEFASFPAKFERVGS